MLAHIGYLCYTIDTNFLRLWLPCFFNCVNNKEMGNSRVLEWEKTCTLCTGLFLYGLFEMKGHAFFRTCDFAYLSKRIDFALI